MENNDGFLNGVAKYYSQKVIEHGETPLGVDWNGLDSQLTRFEQLKKVIGADSGFSINDLGCGYGAFLDYLHGEGFSDFDYHGYDISEDMLNKARNRFLNRDRVFFSLQSRPEIIADYSIASGIFNVSLDNDEREWLEYIKSTIDTLSKNSRKGFAFNCLTSYSDEDKKKPRLFYANPCEIFDICKRCFSNNVALLHDYGLYEFTIIVRK